MSEQDKQKELTRSDKLYFGFMNQSRSPQEALVRACNKIQELESELSAANARAERLEHFSAGRGSVSEAANMQEATVLVLGLQDRAEQAEAHAAAIWEAISKISDLLEEHMPGWYLRSHCVQILAALTPDAGVDLLRRLALVENALQHITHADMTRKEIREYAKDICNKSLFGGEGGEG